MAKRARAMLTESKPGSSNTPFKFRQIVYFISVEILRGNFMMFIKSLSNNTVNMCGLVINCFKGRPIQEIGMGIAIIGSRLESVDG